jgi:hypothetical protein
MGIEYRMKPRKFFEEPSTSQAESGFRWFTTDKDSTGSNNSKALEKDSTSTTGSISLEDACKQMGIEYRMENRGWPGLQTADSIRAYDFYGLRVDDGAIAKRWIIPLLYAAISRSAVSG